MPRLLKDSEIDARLKRLRGWKHEGAFITKTFEFNEFMDGISFVKDVAKVAEMQEHHPDIHVRYTSITLSIQTHDEGGITKWDLDLAVAIEKLRRKRKE